MVQVYRLFKADLDGGCRILEIARTSAAAPTGGALPPQETGAAKPHR